MLLDLLRPSRSAALAQSRARASAADEATGLPGRLAFDAHLARAVRLDTPPTLAVLALGGLDLATLTVGRRWAEAQVIRAAGVLATVTSCDDGVSGYRLGACTFALLFTDEGDQQRDPFALAEAIRHRIERDAEPLTCAIGLAELDGIRASDPETLELAADAALDQALLLGRDGPSPVVTAADQTSGLRWIASSPSSTRSAAP